MTRPIVELRVQDPVVAAAVTRVWRSAYLVEAQRIGRADFPPLRRDQHDIAHAKTRFFGVFVGDLIAALAEIDTSGPGPVEICSLITAPQHFRQGLARRLLQHVVATFGERGLVATTASANAPGLALYASFGFRGERRWTTPDGFDLISLGRPAETTPGSTIQ